MNHHQEILRYLPLQAMAAGFIPLVQFTLKGFAKRQTTQKQRELREKVIALDAFIQTMNRSTEVSEHHTACLRDALLERNLSLQQLASLTVLKSHPPQKLLSRHGVRRLFLLYAPSSPAAWALHSLFFFFLIAALVGSIRSLLRIAYLRPSILIPLVIADFLLAALVRLASFYVDPSDPAAPLPVANPA